jgi:6-phosphogluconolactonase
LHGLARSRGHPDANIHCIPAECGPDVAAAAYAQELAGVPEFDLVLLGLGEDGHTASLFPGHDWSAAGLASVLAITDAPKPPPQRVSLSPARLAATRQLVFLVTGAGKRKAVQDWRAGIAIPASRIAPHGGVDILLDAAANREEYA